MPHTVQVENFRLNYNRLPDICPICHHAVSPVYIGASISGNADDVGVYLDLAFRCPLESCKRMFVGRYARPNTGGNSMRAMGDFTFREAVPHTFEEVHVDEEISAVSQAFESIFKQASAAELYSLNEIAGVGYRKALEFLIKDYCIHKQPELEEAIKASPLGQVINTYVDDANVKKCAVRAAWIGNDETHYLRKWADKDIKDLKILIDLTCGWVKNNILTERYLADMES